EDVVPVTELSLRCGQVPPKRLQNPQPVRARSRADQTEPKLLGDRSASIDELPAFREVSVHGMQDPEESQNEPYASAGIPHFFQDLLAAPDPLLNRRRAVHDRAGHLGEVRDLAGVARATGMLVSFGQRAQR